MRTIVLAGAILLGMTFLEPAEAQPRDVKYDEATVPNYTLPDPLTRKDGQQVTTAADWTKARRAEIVEVFAREVYGRTPQKWPAVTSAVVETVPKALNGAATRKRIRITVGQGSGAVSFEVLLYVPNAAKRPVPVFVGLNFQGNHSTTNEPDVPLATVWPREKGASAGKPAEPGTRGAQIGRWEFEYLVSQGFATATAYYGDIDPDFDDGFRNGIHPLFQTAGWTKRAGDEWGSIGAWAWGLSRIVDALEKDRDIDAKRIALTGHSRLGKTALWAAAQDERFGIVISNDSGEGGAALSKREIGERIHHLNKSFPHWFAENYRQWNQREPELPFDQHMLLSLIAPRPLYVASASLDQWADPKGEFLSLKAAAPVYRLFGREIPNLDAMPAADHPLVEDIGYHMRTGKHDITRYDWQQYVAFAKRQWKMK